MGANGSDTERIYIFLYSYLFLCSEYEYRPGSSTIMKTITIFDKNQNGHDKDYQETDIDTNFKKNNSTNIVIYEK